VRHSVATKAGVVASDEREGGRRALLNFGHTFGHALETETLFSDRLLHGEAVAAGMGLAAELSVRLLDCPAADATRLKRHLEEAGLPPSLGALPGAPLSPDRLIAHMAHDKKTRDGHLTFVLLRRLGQAELVHGVPPQAVREVLQAP
jgi:3-dehydroquinate synthase